MQQAIENDSKKNETPPQYVCPITLQIMWDPVSDIFGNSFERTALTQHYASYNTCPISNAKLEKHEKIIIPNKSLKDLIDQYILDHPEKAADRFVIETLPDDLIKLIKAKDIEGISNLVNDKVEKLAKLDTDHVMKIMIEAHKISEEIEDIYVYLLDIFKEKTIPFLLLTTNGASTFYMSAHKSSLQIIKNMLVALGDQAKLCLTSRYHEDIPTPFMHILLRGDLELAKFAIDKIGDGLKTELEKKAMIYTQYLSGWEILLFNQHSNAREEIITEINQRFSNLFLQLLINPIIKQYSVLTKCNLDAIPLCKKPQSSLVPRGNLSPSIPSLPTSNRAISSPPSNCVTATSSSNIQTMDNMRERLYEQQQRFLASIQQQSRGSNSQSLSTPPLLPPASTTFITNSLSPQNMTNTTTSSTAQGIESPTTYSSPSQQQHAYPRSTQNNQNYNNSEQYRGNGNRRHSDRDPEYYPNKYARR